MSRPNILVIMSDDHAQWAAGCYGNADVDTPNLDYLAKTGVRFANAFTTSPVCSPARASFFSGRLPSQHGMHDYLNELDEEVRATRWLPKERLLPEILHEQGYTTGLSGKWHLGHDDAAPSGFDFWYSHSIEISRPDGYTAPWPTETPSGPGYDRHAITDKAVEFLRRRDHTKPFFLFVGHIATHSPWDNAPDRLVERYRERALHPVHDDFTYPFGRLRSESLYASRDDPREALAQYYASVTDIDDQVGRLIDELELQGLSESTVVVYTSDHGLNAGQHGIWGKGNGTIPYNVVDESIRVPLIVSFPTGILGRQHRVENVDHTDTFATLLELAGTTPPTDLHPTPYPGRSYVGPLMGRPQEECADAVFVEYGNLRMTRTSTMKLVKRYPDGPDELFALEHDPRESADVWDRPEFRAVRDELEATLTSYFARYDESDTSGLRVEDLPRHNLDEAWRDPGPAAIAADGAWMHRLEARIQNERQRGENP
ncbi:sulfatase-like hydrolase/transferase [Microbacterium esteraromaticum]|uniref:Sulfatase-like hydrolase/transferase n=1 Tax=Microbacterium esteraromaticum TaxID=57043 RepID=A0A7D7WCJ0_9MICO|nr:sulfatase-like hydrolase/transferase [Microbacterium esteraromaticum]QMU96272.1 sulfatase-like hydrolase/transferase [Microbacterium esteraromaticum]